MRDPGAGYVLQGTEDGIIGGPTDADHDIVLPMERLRQAGARFHLGPHVFLEPPIASITCAAFPIQKGNARIVRGKVGIGMPETQQRAVVGVGHHMNRSSRIGPPESLQQRQCNDQIAEGPRAVDEDTHTSLDGVFL